MSVKPKAERSSKKKPRHGSSDKTTDLDPLREDASLVEEKHKKKKRKRDDEALADPGHLEHPEETKEAKKMKKRRHDENESSTVTVSSETPETSASTGEPHKVNKNKSKSAEDDDVLDGDSKASKRKKKKRKQEEETDLVNPSADESLSEQARKGTFHSSVISNALAHLRRQPSPTPTSNFLTHRIGSLTRQGRTGSSETYGPLKRSVYSLNLRLICANNMIQPDPRNVYAARAAVFVQGGRTSAGGVSETVTLLIFLTKGCLKNLTTACTGLLENPSQTGAPTEITEDGAEGVEPKSILKVTSAAGDAAGQNSAPAPSDAESQALMRARATAVLSALSGGS